VGAGNRGPVGSIQQAAPMAALNLQDGKQSNQAGVDVNTQNEISAQKKYKLELQAEINKLRSKY
jgi:hypothetical protein